MAGIVGTKCTSSSMIVRKAATITTTTTTTTTITTTAFPRLDREFVDHGRRLAATQESVLVLMEKKEVLQATRHAALLKCLEEVNGALGDIYGQLTSVESEEKTWVSYMVRGYKHSSRQKLLLRHVLGDAADWSYKHRLKHGFVWRHKPEKERKP